jgi:hypothetical protein
MGIFDKVGETGKGVADKAKNITEISNMKRKIAYEQERIVEIFTDIGRKYYKNHEEDPQVLQALCEDIDTRRRRIKKMHFEMNTMRGYKVCPKCDSEINEKFLFCGVCGAKLPNPEDIDKLSLEDDEIFTESTGFFKAEPLEAK